MKVIQNLNEQLTRLEQGSKPVGPHPQGERLPKRESRCWKAPEAAYVEPKPPDPSWITPHQNPCTLNFLLNSYADDYKGADKTKLYTFSGKRNYLDWERNLDEWFYYNNILKKERLAYAIDQLRDVALKWWVQEEDDIRFYKEPPITTWRDLREIMRDKYAKKYTNSQIKELYPRRYPTHSSKKAELKSKTPTQKIPAKAEQQTEKHKQFCPTKQLLVETSLEKKTDLSMMRIKKHEEEAQGVTFVMGQKMVQDTMQSMLLKEAKPVIRVSHQ
ncbi:uncharacterized protein LOC130507716, partial [Raphanus sativus]|uniref:Uncharacterized protein LOC130507716 n=1 Tax=Raphanus sativus TaxID=3726 RepID=A0A9W3D355_RAPSA